MAIQTPEEILKSAEKVEVEPALNQLIDSFLKGISAAYNDHPELKERGISFSIALAALFDLCVNGLYARNAVASGWIYCADKSSKFSDKHFEGDYLYYPFVAACSRCAVKGHFHRARANKPPSDTIGSANAKVIAALYDRVAQASPGSARVLRVPGRQDADLVFVEDDNMCVSEIKASPLVSYPLAVATDPIEELDPDTGKPRKLDHHREATANHLSKDPIYLYIPHVGGYVYLGPMAGGDWPLDSLADYVSSSDGAARIAVAWYRLFRIYANKKLRKSDNAWYLVNGCGSAPSKSGGFPISDAKNMPGIDRTDDLKKGTYQVLKMGATLKDRRDNSVRAALVANVHAVIHDEVYVADLANVVWTKDGPDDSYVVRRDAKEWVIRAEGIFNLYDGIICITESRFRDEWLKKIADVNALQSAKS